MLAMWVQEWPILLGCQRSAGIEAGSLVVNAWLLNSTRTHLLEQVISAGVPR